MIASMEYGYKIHIYDKNINIDVCMYVYEYVCMWTSIHEDNTVVSSVACSAADIERKRNDMPENRFCNIMPEILHLLDERIAHERENCTDQPLV